MESCWVWYHRNNYSFRSETAGIIMWLILRASVRISGDIPFSHTVTQLHMNSGECLDWLVPRLLQNWPKKKNSTTVRYQTRAINLECYEQSAYHFYIVRRKDCMYVPIIAGLSSSTNIHNEQGGHDHQGVHIFRSLDFIVIKFSRHVNSNTGVVGLGVRIQLFHWDKLRHGFEFRTTQTFTFSFCIFFF